MDEIMLLLSGALLCNCIPHLSKGLSGESFPTPFAKPSGVGNSSALVNMLWGAFNLFLGVFIAMRRSGSIGTMPGLIALGAGFMLVGVFTSLHFAKVRKSTS